MKEFIVNAFIGENALGNPAGVCILDEDIDSEKMQWIAFKNALPETAFVSMNDDNFDLRWFSPLAEVDLCGHATLASAYILWDKKILDLTKDVVFNTKSGILTAKRVQDHIVLDFPLEVDFQIPITQEIENALGTKIIYYGKNRRDQIIEIESADVLRSLQPDMEALKKIDAMGFIVTSKSDDERFDFVSRFFAPGIGIDEDPATGSAHCCLGPYWKRKTGKTAFKAYQASKRGGILMLEVGVERVLIFGKAEEEN